MKGKLKRNTLEEEAAIRQGIEADPDTFELTDDDFARVRPASEMMPDLVRRRGSQKAPKKLLVSIRLDQDVVQRLRASGPGWQGRVNDLLRKSVA
jgi:uncharacterized protein (DUF4415 family)